jgi:hypothetical protein
MTPWQMLAVGWLTTLFVVGIRKTRLEESSGRSSSSSSSCVLLLRTVLKGFF